ncbi:MAG: methyl-accepting chemotaxis protein [Lacrimispora sp.]|nr:methyl-accepting chemotaxis protein [Lacrimispora sp.]
MSMMNKRKKRIFTKLLFGISMPVIIILILSGFLITTQVGNSMERQSMENLNSASLAAANQVDSFLTFYLAEMKSAAASEQVETYLKNATGKVRLPNSEGYPEIKKTLDKLQATDKDNILAAWIADLDLSQVTQSDNFTSEDGWDISSRPWYRAMELDHPILTEPYVDASTGQVIVSAVCGVFDGSTGKPLGVMGLDIKLSQLVTIMGNYRIGTDGFVVLATEGGQIVYHPNNDMIQKNVAEVDMSENIKQAITTQAAGNYKYTMNQESYFGAVNRVGDSGWLVLSSIPKSEALASRMAVTTTITAVFFLGSALLVLLIFLISKGMTKPLRKLSHVAEQIAKGKLDLAMENFDNDEIGMVASSLGNTVLQLKDYVNYIDEITSVLNQIADRNLAFQLEYDYKGNFEKVKSALLKIRTTLTATMERIVSASEQVAYGSQNISGSAQALAQGATEQASAVEELAATINDISHNIEKNAQDSTSANEQAVNAANELEISSRHMEALVNAMEEISENSAEISKIIKTIEDIAFQTNILALNAAVEAARAGEAGKGFAVVADEVRNLASKSSEAAQNTTHLIEGSIQSVMNGSSLVKEAAESLSTAVAGTRSVSGMIERISQASVRQSEAIRQVTVGIDQISAVVQTNSATAEESAAASKELSDMANVLKELVEEFQLNNQ